MKYFVSEFQIVAPEELMQDARDLLSALAAEAGFEAFEETETGLKGYVQQQLFDRDMLEAVLHDFPFEGVSVTFEVSEAEDRDWNEQWEKEGFEPIVIKGDRTIVIHDGRHLPETLSSPLSVEIDAHLAFGTGTHETTRMMVTALSDLQLEGCRVLDCGCGTGILGIVALMMGAAEAVGYDMDEWSADNARHNAVINRLDDRFTSLLGDVSVLSAVEGQFQVVMANINRNILLADMPAFRSKMTADGRLLLSGFYTTDIPMLQDKAVQLGMRMVSQYQEGEWACLVFRAEI